MYPENTLSTFINIEE